MESKTMNKNIDKETIVYASSKKNFLKMLKSEILQRSFNRTAVWNLPKRNWILRHLLGHIDGNPYLVQIPFHVSWGCNIHIGKNFFANNNLVILDHATVTIGDNCFIAPNVTIATMNHPMLADERRVFATKDSFHPEKKGNIEVNYPITIGNDVWIGAGSIILPGVTIGTGAIIGAGSVVNKDIPSNVLACGVPCKVVRTITEEDRVNIHNIER